MKPVLGLLLVSGALALAQPQPKTYAFKVIVSSGRGATGYAYGAGMPLRGANVRLTGSGIRAAEYPEVGAVEQLTGSGVNLNDSGTLTLYLRAGHYKVEFSHPAHRSFTAWYTVPPPGLESATEFESYIDLAMRDDVMTRYLTVAVDGESGNGNFGPLTNARVRVYRDGRLTRGTGVDSQGLAVFNQITAGFDQWGRELMKDGFAIGDYVRIEASAEGYETQETTFIIGSAQEGRPDPRRTNLTTNSDFVSMVLRKPRAPTEPIPVSMIVEVLNGQSNAPVVGAKVEVELTNGRWSEWGNTIGTGRTLRLDLEPFTPGKVYNYRVKVSAPGFEPKWSDVPPELIAPGAPRVYVVHLTPQSNDPTMTAAERATLARMLQWANARPNREKVYTTDTVVDVQWKEMKTGTDGPPEYRGHLEVTFHLPKPGDPPPGPMPVTAGRERIMVGAVPAVRDPKNYRVLIWNQGRFGVWLSYFSSWLIRPTEQELMALATEVAGLIGGGAQ